MPPRLPPTLEALSADTRAFLDVLNQESDLAVALIGASYLDHCLGSTLRRRLKPGKVTDTLLEPNQALGTFGVRIDLCFALGSYSELIRGDLKTVARIRNIFAHHHLTRTFRDAEVIKECTKLKYVASLATPDGPSVFREALADERFHFVLTVAMLSQQLMVEGLGAVPLHQTG